MSHYSGVKKPLLSSLYPILNTGSVAYNLTTRILQALAAGTLLYLVVFKVLQREKRKEKVPGMVQHMFVLLG